MNVPKFHAVPGLTVQASAVLVFDQLSLVTLVEAQTKDPVVGLVIPYICKGENQRAWSFKKLGVKGYVNTCFSLIT